MTNGVSVSPVRIPALSQLDWLKLLLGLAALGLVIYAYWFQRVEHELTAYHWLVGHWSNVSNYSHGPLIPLIALGILWWKRKELMAVPRIPMNAGLSVVTLAMVIYYLGVKAIQPRAVVVSFVVLLYGLTLVVGGRGLFRVLFFPVSFLFLMIPLNFLDESIGFPLRMMMTSASAWLLNFLGVETIRQGTALFSPAGVFQLDVAAPCSGIRSLMALMTVTAAFGYITQRVQWKRWVLFLSAMPLAVLGNMARVTSIAIVASVYGERFASTDYHDAAGFIVYGVALTAMVALGFLLDFSYQRVLDNWLRPPQASRRPADKPLPPLQQRETL